MPTVKIARSIITDCSNKKGKRKTVNEKLSTLALITNMVTDIRDLQ